MGEFIREKNSSGILYVVATPIGNLEDLTFRALKVLNSVSFIACEDTRQTIKLLNRYKIKKKLISYFHPQEQRKKTFILNHLLEGKDIALVSDAGTPGISDPGYPLIKDAVKKNIKVVPIPGASAVTAALSAAALPTHRFLFLGFPPPKKNASKKLLDTVKQETGTLIFYLPARKIQLFLTQIRETLGEREVVIAREITKVYENFLRGTPSELIPVSDTISQKGEVTVLISGFSKKIQ